jgi:hypothetical protein
MTKTKIASSPRTEIEMELNMYVYPQVTIASILVYFASILVYFVQVGATPLAVVDESHTQSCEPVDLKYSTTRHVYVHVYMYVE